MASKFHLVEVEHVDALQDEADSVEGQSSNRCPTFADAIKMVSQDKQMEMEPEDEQLPSGNIATKSHSNWWKWLKLLLLWKVLSFSAMLAVLLARSGWAEFTNIPQEDLVPDYDEDELKDAFTAFDKDCNGFLTNEELKKALMEPDDEQIQSIMDKPDASHDGNIQIDEFIILMKNVDAEIVTEEVIEEPVETPSSLAVDVEGCVGQLAGATEISTTGFACLPCESLIIESKEPFKVTSGFAFHVAKFTSSNMTGVRIQIPELDSCPIPEIVSQDKLIEKTPEKEDGHQEKPSAKVWLLGAAIPLAMGLKLVLV